MATYATMDCAAQAQIASNAAQDPAEVPEPAVEAPGAVPGQKGKQGG